MPLVMPEVYSLYFPETAAAARELRTDPVFDSWYDEAWLGRENAVPGRFLDTWRRWSGWGLDAFPHAAIGNGSSEILRELVCGPEIVVFEGDYEGYAYNAAARGVPVRRIDRLNPFVGLEGVAPGSVFFISEPSAIDGDHWPNLAAFLAELHTRFPSLRVVLDASYVGLTREPRTVSVVWPNVGTVVFSLSKPFGLYRHRVGGMVSREHQPLFAYNHWFNSLFGLKLGTLMMDRHAPGDLPRRYAGLQEKVVRMAMERGEVGADAQPCNVLLLARGALPHAEARYNRASGQVRYCLTPGLHALIHEGAS
ncbi:MAG: hypothetical protein EXR71_19175 [Myxococcales bacterium]|nr:hypothetical protein [Myxococcales bacterium]